MLDQNTKSARIFRLSVLLAFCGLLFFPYLGRIPLFDKGEPREMLVVQSIVMKGTWFFPLRDHGDIPSKPPLFHWVSAVTSLAWGKITEFTLRFPSALFATLGVFLLYLLGRRIFDPQIAFLGGLVLATSLVYQDQAVSARVDMTLTFVVTLNLVLFYALYRGYLIGEAWTYVFFASVGVGVLAKGPVSVVLSGMVVAAFLALRRRWDWVLRLCFHKGTLLALAIMLSWYGLALVRGGEDFFDRQLLKENLSRFFIYGEGGTGHQKPPYYYIPYLFVDGLPWSLFVPLLVISLSRKFHRDRNLGEDTSFLVVWTSTVFLFFSLAAGKRAVYLLPLYPPLSLLIAAWFLNPTERSKAEGACLRLLGALSFLVGLGLLVLLIGGLWEGEAGWFLSAYDSALKPKDQESLTMIRQGLNGLPWLFLPFLFFSSLLWVSLARGLWTFRIRTAPLRITLIAFLCGLLAHSAIVPSIAASKSYDDFIKEVNRLAPPGTRLYLWGGDFDRVTLDFYRGGPIAALHEELPAVAKRLRSTPDYIIMSEDQWAKIRLFDENLPPPLLESRGKGAEGNSRLVLLRGNAGGRS